MESDDQTVCGDQSPSGCTSPAEALPGGCGAPNGGGALERVGHGASEHDAGSLLALLASMPVLPGRDRPRVLLVDDDRRMRWAVGELLAALGMEVVGELGDGTEVAAAVEESCPDVVVTDLRMPAVDGVAAARAARRADPWVRVVMFSAALEAADDGERAAALGAHALVPRGVLPDVLLWAVARALTVAARDRRTGRNPPGADGFRAAYGKRPDQRRLRAAPTMRTRAAAPANAAVASRSSSSKPSSEPRVS